MLKQKSFAMSMFASSSDLYKAKAEYYEGEATKLETALSVALETVAHLERVTLKLDNENKELNKRLSA